MIMCCQRDIPLVIRRLEARYIPPVQHPQHCGIHPVLPYPVHQVHEFPILLPVNVFQLDCHVTGCCQSLTMEKERRCVMLFQQRPLVLFHHGSQLLQITDQQQLHPTERLVLGAVTTQHIIHRIQQICPYHTDLVNHQQINRLDNIDLFPVKFMGVLQFFTSLHRIRTSRHVWPERQLEERVDRHPTRINCRHSRGSNHNHPFG